MPLAHPEKSAFQHAYARATRPLHKLLGAAVAGVLLCLFAAAQPAPAAGPVAKAPAGNVVAGDAAATARAPVVAAPEVAAPAPEAAAARPAPPHLVAIWRRIFARPQEIPAPPGNPSTPAKVTLGQLLFHDMRLSGVGNRSCASCHLPDLAYSDGRARALGLSGKDLQRNAPSLMNLAWSKFLFHDGRAESLEAQARVPIEHPEEMRGDLEVIAKRLRRDKDMVASFAQSFPKAPAVTSQNVLKALAAFERSLVSPPTRFDAWIAGDDMALSAAEMAGFRLFAGKGGCMACHRGWRFTDDKFHNIGVKSKDPGRGAIPGGVPGLAAFKTPGLREIAKTAPYMHDGSMASLEAVIDHYAGGFEKQPNLAATLPRDLELTREEKAQLIAFLKTL